MCQQHNNCKLLRKAVFLLTLWSLNYQKTTHFQLYSHVSSKYHYPVKWESTTVHSVGERASKAFTQSKWWVELIDWLVFHTTLHIWRVFFSQKNIYSGCRMNTVHNSTAEILNQILFRFSNRIVPNSGSNKNVSFFRSKLELRE